MKMRTVTQFWRELREADPRNAIGLGFLRAAVADGTIPTIKMGRRYLLDADTALDHLFAGCGIGNQSEGVRRVD